MQVESLTSCPGHPIRCIERITEVRTGDFGKAPLPGIENYVEST